MSLSITLRKWLQQEPFALAMSSGFFGFYAHCGFIAALEEEQLFPSQISGCSAGAIIAGSWATGLSAKDIRNDLFSIQRQDFWDPYPGLGFLRGRLFQERLYKFLPTTDFHQCRFPISISVYDVFSFTTRVLTKGDLVLAICASCTVPLLFHPVWINGQPYLDGGLLDHGGLAGFPKNTRILYHHLTSKINKSDNTCSPRLPRRNNMINLVISQLPKVNPFRLQCGKQAYQIAYQATKSALDAPLNNSKIFV